MQVAHLVGMDDEGDNFSGDSENGIDFLFEFLRLLPTLIYTYCRIIKTQSRNLVLRELGSRVVLISHSTLPPVPCSGSMFLKMFMMI
jgi:hypothetical protein